MTAAPPDRRALASVHADIKQGEDERSLKATEEVAEARSADPAGLACQLLAESLIDLLMPPACLPYISRNTASSGSMRLTTSRESLSITRPCPIPRIDFAGAAIDWEDALTVGCVATDA